MSKVKASDKKLWNEAIRKATNEVFKYDGIISSEIERRYIRDEIRNRLSYKIKSKEGI